MTTLTGSPAVPLNGISDQEGEAAEARLIAAVRETWRVFDRQALDTLPPPDPLIDGVLPRRGLVLASGERGLGKTFLGISVGTTVSTDLPTWMGHDVVHHGPVLYVALEGFHGIPERVRAWERWAGRKADAITWMNGAVDLKRWDHRRALATEVRATGAVLVIVDSVRASGSASEDTKDMGQFTLGLEHVRDHSDALVMALHNTGWDATRERGGTVLPDACDTTLILQGSPTGVRTLTHRKFRDGPWMDPLRFTFRPIPGTTSGVLVPAADTARDDDLTPIQRAVVSVVTAEQGLNTAEIARRSGKHRPNVSTALGELRDLGTVENRGTAQKPSWYLPDDHLPEDPK